MIPRFAYLENGPCRDAVSGLPERIEASGFAVDRFWSYRREFPDLREGYAGVLLSGSPHGAYEKLDFINDEHEFICNVAAACVPMLGICFGSQILASALCGRDQVFRRSSCHVGFLPLRATERFHDDALMSGLPTQFQMLVWHNDEIKADHPDMILLAVSDIAPNQIWRYRDRSIWGIQGHPEVTGQNAAAWLDRVREAMTNDGVEADTLAGEISRKSSGEPAGFKMVDNFLVVCREYQSQEVNQNQTRRSML